MATCDYEIAAAEAPRVTGGNVRSCEWEYTGIQALPLLPAAAMGDPETVTACDTRGYRVYLRQHEILGFRLQQLQVSLAAMCDAETGDTCAIDGNGQS